MNNITLNKFIAQAGITSRRKAVELIEQGHVTVNDKVMKEPGYRVKKSDNVKVRGQELQAQKHVYVLLNKPNNYITTLNDERGRKTVIDLLGDAVQERVYPIGRLDRSTTGLLLLTNDGALAQKLAHPKYKIQKTYLVTLDKSLTFADVKKLRAGIVLEDGKVLVDALTFIPGKSKKVVQLSVHSGKNRIIRRMFEHLGYKVIKLDRTMYAGLTKRHLPVGTCRFLTSDEIKGLKH